MKKKFSNVIDYGCGSGLLAIIAKLYIKPKFRGGHRLKSN